MTRRDTHFDAMLRHLGASYYQTLRGEGSPAEVAKALDSVEREISRRRGEAGERPAPRTGPRSGRWRVRDVMTKDVIAVDRRATSAQIARLLAEHHINAMPVLSDKRRVVGVVSEADLLRTQQRPASAWLPGRRARRSSPRDHFAAQLMTAPAVTIHPDAPLATAARRMTSDHFILLPVVEGQDELIGVVTRRDLLRVFLRPDEEIAAEVTAMLTDLMMIDPHAVTVSARDGIVTLTGELPDQQQRSSAVRLAGEIDGVLAVIDKLSVPSGTAVPAR
jgi:CBS domain-containing protein